MRYFMSNLQIRRHLLRFMSSGGKCETCANGESCACLASLPPACDCFLRSPRHRLVLAFACVKSVRSVTHRKFYLKAFLIFQFYLDFWSAFRLNFFKCKLKPMTNGSCSIVAQKVGCWLKFQVRRLKESVRYRRIVRVQTQKCQLRFTKRSPA